MSAYAAGQLTGKIFVILFVLVVAWTLYKKYKK